MMENLFALVLTAGLAILVYVSIVWLISLIKKDAGIMDIFWGLGFILVTAIIYFISDGSGVRSTLLLLLVTVWGLRLALHIGYRNAGKPEDARYRKWREENGKNWWWKSYLKVFLLQGMIMWIVSLPLIFTMANKTSPLTLLDYSALALWATGMFFEVVGDWQLLRFKNKPENKGMILNRGLWQYTRHPNYFGEMLIWWGFYLVALADGHPLTIISPVIMTFLLVRVSGVKMLDELLLQTKPDYAAYVKAVNAFIPGRPPK